MAGLNRYKAENSTARPSSIAFRVMRYTRRPIAISQKIAGSFKRSRQTPDKYGILNREKIAPITHST